jgi:hypothetical protein
MKVQQELMRHARSTTTNVYGRAMTETKRLANSQVVGLVFGPNTQKSAQARLLRRYSKLQSFLLGDNWDLPEATNFIVSY